MTPTPEQIAALAAIEYAEAPEDHGQLCPAWTRRNAVPAPTIDACNCWVGRRAKRMARAIAALPDWALVPTAEVERLRRIEAATRAVCESPLYTPELEPTVVFDALRAALAGDAP